MCEAAAEGGCNRVRSREKKAKREAEEKKADSEAVVEEKRAECEAEEKPPWN